MDEARVQTALAVQAGAVGERVVADATLRWGVLYEQLGGSQPEYVAAIEMVYEGYLLHYRRSRVTGVTPQDRAAALLAGDGFYAAGLRLVAERGDVTAVALLSGLMAACSSLRDAGEPLAADDRLWAYTVAAMAADAGLLFIEVQDALAEGRPARLPALVRDAAARLPLDDPAPLLDALAAADQEE